MPARALIFAFFWAILLLVMALPAEAQVEVTDSITVDEPPNVMVEAEEFERINIPDSASLPDPRKSAFLSTILPGMGQVYNGSLWKVPLVYAGGVVIISTVNFYNLRYSESLKSLRTIRFNPAITEVNERDEQFYQRAVDFYRRQRDFTIILGVAFYGLQIVEAYVDAHLQTFNLDEELSMRVRPTLIPDPTGTMLAGVRITYTFP